MGDTTEPEIARKWRVNPSERHFYAMHSGWFFLMLSVIMKIPGVEIQAFTMFINGEKNLYLPLTLNTGY